MLRSTSKAFVRVTLGGGAAALATALAFTPLAYAGTGHLSRDTVHPPGMLADAGNGRLSRDTVHPPGMLADAGTVDVGATATAAASLT